MSRLGRIGRIVWRIGAGLAVVVFLVVMMLWLSGTFRHKTEPAAPTARVKLDNVTTRPVERRTFPLIVEQVGSIRNRMETNIASRVMSQVIEIAVREGDSVQGPPPDGAATVLIRLDDRDLQARLRQGQAQIEALQRAEQSATANRQSAQAQIEAATARRDQALADFQRYEKLFAGGAATGRQLEQARTQKDVAEAQLRSAETALQAAQGDIERTRAQIEQARSALVQAQVQLSYTEIRAPFSGRVTRKLVEVGDTVGPGQPLLILETESQPELHAAVSESLLGFLAVGDSLTVYVDALQREYAATVREVDPRSDPATRTLRVKVALGEAPGLISGMFARLRIPTGRYEALVVPRRALQQVGQLDLVEIVDSQGCAQKRFVTLGPPHGADVEVLSGLAEGQQVVIP